jgi:hypothetical protein
LQQALQVLPAVLAAVPSIGWRRGHSLNPRAGAAASAR